MQRRKITYRKNHSDKPKNGWFHCYTNRCLYRPNGLGQTVLVKIVTALIETTDGEMLQIEPTHIVFVKDWAVVSDHNKSEFVLRHSVGFPFNFLDLHMDILKPGKPEEDCLSILRDFENLRKESEKAANDSKKEVECLSLLKCLTDAPAGCKVEVTKEMISTFTKMYNYLLELIHHKDSTCGLWATDRPDVIPNNVKREVFHEIKF